MTYTLLYEKQASAERTAAYNAEVSELKQSLTQAEEELGRVKKQLEDKQGMLKTFVLKLARINSCAR